MADLAKLSAGYARLKTGTLWSSAGKCKGFAVSNPGEASQIDSYVAALAAGQYPAAPSLATATGQGIVAIIDGGYGRPPAATLTVTISGADFAGSKLTATATGG